MSRLFAGLDGPPAQFNRWGVRKPYAQISFRAPGVETNGLSLGIRYRPFSLTVLVAECSFRSGMMRRILPSRLWSRWGLDLIDPFVDSPDAPSPHSMYSTRQSGSPRRAVGLKMRSPRG